jgi:hypothetical protein
MAVVASVLGRVGRGLTQHGGIAIGVISARIASQSFLFRSL